MLFFALDTAWTLMGWEPLIHDHPEMEDVDCLVRVESDAVWRWPMGHHCVKGLHPTCHPKHHEAQHFFNTTSGFNCKSQESSELSEHQVHDQVPAEEDFAGVTGLSQSNNCGRTDNKTPCNHDPDIAETTFL